MDDLNLMSKALTDLSESERHERRMGWFVAEAYRQASNRARMAKCEQYYDQHQTDEQRRRDIEARGQTVVQYDMVTPQIDWLIGTERRMRIDEKIMPRRTLDEQSTVDADNKTQLLKWIDDTNRTGYQRSAAWDDAMKAGMGWLEVFAFKDKDGWNVGKQAVPWKHCLYDSLGLEKTGTGKMRYFFRMKPVDLDIAIAHFPHKKTELLRVASASTGFQELRSWMGMPNAMLDLDSIMGRLESDAGAAMPSDMFNARQRVLLVECWSLEPYQELDEYGTPSLDAPCRLRPAVSIMTEFDTIWEGWSPYDHDQIPFVPYWAYADKTTGLPYSLIHRLIPRQDALNKVMSRALHDISVDQLHTEVTAIDDETMTLEELRNELDDPGGIAVFAEGGMEKSKVIKNTESAEAHMNMANKLTESISQSAVVNRESTGGGLPGVSGVAMGKREDQSTLQTAEFFDGLVLAHIMEGELTLSVMEQYMNDPMVIPAKDPRGVPIHVAINQPGQPTLKALRARYVITEQPWRASLGQAQFESLMLVLKDMAGAAPQVVMALLDTVFEYADIPNKQQIVERIRSVTGQQAPDQKPTPQQIQMAQRKAAVDDATFKKVMAELIADAQVANAKGFQLQADTWVKRLEALGLAATVAQQSAMNPLLTPATDSILLSVGVQDMHPAAGAAPLQLPDTSGVPPGAPTPSALPPAPPQPMAMMTPPRPAALPYPGAPA
jgi:hypothetical protein